MLVMHEENNKSFLEELRSLDEATKRKVAVVATAILMIGVVYVWVGYFNGLVTGTSEQSTVADGQAQVGSTQPVAENSNNASSAGSGFGQNIKSGIAVIGSYFAGVAQWLVGLVKNPGQYNIHPSQ